MRGHCLVNGFGCCDDLSVLKHLILSFKVRGFSTGLFDDNNAACDIPCIECRFIIDIKTTARHIGQVNGR